MRKAVILFNLGGPDSPKAVEPFLFNLFYDKNIIAFPNPFRFLLAKLISKSRKNTAIDIYSKIGNKSPILEETDAQRRALEKELNDSSSEIKWKVFTTMRYWHPFAYETIRDVKLFKPDEIILLPLYPQFSTTTSKSSIDDWLHFCEKNNFNVHTQIICNYSKEENFINAHVSQLRECCGDMLESENTRILFSAHGLPKKIIDKGDPYQKHIEISANAIIQKLGIDNIDHTVCYQSKVGPMEWIGPSTVDEIKRAGRDKKAIVIVPIAFVSEHSETLVELDIEYKALANEQGVVHYLRVPAVGVNKYFISQLGDICKTPSKFICHCYMNSAPGKFECSCC